VDCQQAIELLPWYLNGSLDAAEKADLERHLEGCEACRAELREVEAARLLFGAHPPVRALLAYAETTAASRDLIEAHLAGCEACAEELAMLLESRAEMDREAAPARAARPDSRGRVVPLRRPRAPRPIWRTAAVAAVLVGLIGVAGGLWGWRALDHQRAAESRIAELETELRGLAGARLNVPIHDLWPDGSVVRSASAGPMRFPVADGPAATLILNSQLEPGTELQRLEIRDAASGVLHSLNGVGLGEGGSITMSLQLNRLPRGALRILLFAPDSEEPLESYSLELE